MRNTVVVLLLVGAIVVAGWFAAPYLANLKGNRVAPSPFLTTDKKVAAPSQQAAIPPEQAQAPMQQAAKPADDVVPTTESVLITSTGEGPPLPPPYYPIAVDHDRQALWIAKEEGINGVLHWWNPTTGMLKTFQLPDDPFSFFKTFPAVAATPSGLILIGGQYPAERKWKYDPTRVALITRDSKLLMARLQVERDRPNLIVLRDGSVLVVGGFTQQFEKRYGARGNSLTNAVERISYVEGKLSIERLPDLPGEPRRGISLVELNDGRVMALGGSSSTSMAGVPFFSDTYFLDPVAKSWTNGPKMNEARARAKATLLPNGDVLVTGGWTPKYEWQNGPADSTERWDSMGNQFVPASSLPLKMALHQAVWAPGDYGKQLLLMGGMVQAWDGNHVVLAYDVTNNVWRSVGENCVAHNRDGSVFVVSLENTARSQIWCFETDTPLERAWSVVALRVPSDVGKPASQISLETGIALQRVGLAFLTPQGEMPGLAAGGSVNGSAAATVDALWLDGRIQALAPLNHARRHAQVFRLTDGSFLVTGGVSGDRSKRSEVHPPPEILPGGVALAQARWVDLDIPLPKGSIWGQLNDGSLMVVKPDGGVEQIRISQSPDGKPVIRRNELPPLNRVRRWYQGNNSGINVVIRELGDKRVIVAGGEVPRHRIAMLDDNALTGDGPDHYVGLGEHIQSKHYEIYDPVAQVWNESRPSHAEGSLAAILNDGRVVKWGTISNPSSQDADNAVNSQAEPTGILEISNADGTAWQEFKTQQPPKINVSHYGFESKPFVIDDELFLSGSIPETRSGIGLDAVQWFNAATQVWETVWEVPPGQDWRDHVGRIIIRNLPNGKRVMLPVTEQ